MAISDWFKRFKRNAGALEEYRELIRQNIRPTDIAARLGGDEFCVILNELRSAENAEQRAQDAAEPRNGQAQIDAACHGNLEPPAIEQGGQGGGQKVIA